MEARITFREYLADLPAPYIPIGDFVRSVRKDMKPSEAASQAEPDAYLVSRGASHKIREAGEKVWSDYQKALKHRHEI